MNRENDRGLTDRGMKDARAILTVQALADARGLTVCMVDNLRLALPSTQPMVFFISNDRKQEQEMTDNRNAITDRLPHRYPFLMVDCITGLQAGQWAKGTKRVTGTEWYFAGQTPGPTMPHTMIVEALAQLGALAAMGHGGKLGFLSSIKGAEFCGHASPGDCLDLEYTLLKARRGFVVGSGQASVNGKVIVKVDEIMVYVESDTKERLL